MENIKRLICSNKTNFVLLFIWLFITIFTLFHHEIWRDEAQAWCIVRDLNLIDAFNMSRVEGHPFLWYLFLMPFAKLGLPVESMQIVSLMAVFIAMIFLFFKSPFNKLEKILVCFSAGMIYYLPIVARNYSLIPLFLFLTAYLYLKRFERPYLYAITIAFLSQTHLYMLGLCVILFLLFCYESFKEKQKTNFFPLVLLMINFLFIFFCFNQAQNENYALIDGINNILPLKSVVLLISQIFSFQIINLIPALHKYFNSISLLLFLPFVGIIAYKFYRLNKKVFLIFAFSNIFMFYVFTHKYFNGIIYQKSFLLFLVILFCYWLIKIECVQKSKAIMIAFCGLFFISFLTSPIVLNQEIKYNFSGGKQIAKYIKTNLNTEDTFIAYGNPFVYSPISAYLPDKKFYNVISETYISFYTFKNNRNFLKAEFPQNAKYHIIHDEIQNLEEKGFNVLFVSDENNLSSKTQEEIFNICLLK